MGISQSEFLNYRMRGFEDGSVAVLNKRDHEWTSYYPDDSLASIFCVAENLRHKLDQALAETYARDPGFYSGRSA